MEQTIRFTAPVFIGDTIAATAKILDCNNEKKRVKLLTECHIQKSELLLTGKAIIMVPSKGELV